MVRTARSWKKWHLMVSKEFHALLLRFGLELAELELYYCSICDLSFSFKSKLERHLVSASHSFFANAIEIERSCETMETNTEVVCIMCVAYIARLLPDN